MTTDEGVHNQSGGARATTNIGDAMILRTVFTRTGEATELPKFALGDSMLLPETAYQIVHDEAMLDGNARLNLATFVSTWMDSEAQKLYAETVDKNMIDKDEYPQTAAIEDRCWRILADLWHNPDVENAIGTSTIGSSEACMLGGLALKRHWQTRRRAEGKSTENPNIVLSTAVQVCWEKFCNYFEVEPKWVRSVPTTSCSTVMNSRSTWTRTPSGSSPSWGRPTRACTSR